jgi:cytochrome P450
MDLAKKIPYFTLDVISHVGLGEPFGDLLADKDQKGYLQASEEGLKIGNTAFALGFGWLRNTPIIGPAISPSEKDENGYGRMMAEARKIVNARRSRSTESKSDMLASFIRNGVSGDDLFQEAFEQILAGSDTTAAAIRVIMLYIITHPRVYKKLQAEIDEAVKSGASGSGIISDAQARKLPYLGAVVREGMRVSPPTSTCHTKLHSLLNIGPSTCCQPLLPRDPSLRRHRHHLQHRVPHPRRHLNRLLRMVDAPQQHLPIRL